MHELIDYSLRGQSIVCRRAVDLLALPLDPFEFLLQSLRMISESVSACWALPVELGVVPPGGGSILSFILQCA
jgi:hypothetical protein